ncbi:hypothetical protein [Nostoc sp. MG11]|uniref:hypothetical protein n=1 Tax=Nostoc sp. MG11 TaxID=2721166 RepID=UPI001D008A21|nr:hypothetical protein [Nostoc sp. MG11]
MSSAIPSQFIRFQMLFRNSKRQRPAHRLLYLFVGGWLALTPHSTSAQAQIHNSSVLLAQQRVVETLPPPPDLQPIPYGQQPLPQLEPVQPVQVNQYERDFQPFQPAQANKYSQNFERYLVYVDSNDPRTLEQIRLIEPRAYIRQYQGRTVIQSGVFSRASNAQQRVRELKSYGINSARIVSFADGQEVTTSSSFRGDPGRDNSRRQESRYYVAIPAKAEELAGIAARIRQNLGQNGGVFERLKPRGPHVAVGPFPERFQAEEWNKYLRDYLGYGDARVYYGK